MSRERWVFVAILGALGLLVVALLLTPRFGEARAPHPVAAWVGIEAPGSGVARVGRVELEAGTTFRLHAILEARDHRGQPLYFSEAPAVELEGSRVPQEALQRWPEHRRARVLWFTIEGLGPYLAVTGEPDLRRFDLGELFRPQWPQAWTIPGRMEPAHDEPLRRGLDRELRDFGIQRYHVRIELFDAELDLVPRERVRSWGASDLSERLDAFPTVIVTLPEPLRQASRVFGLAQIDPVAPLAPELEAEIEELERKELVFRSDSLLERHLEAHGTSIGELVWREAFLGDGRGPSWQDEVRPGDLLRVGERVVILYRDREPEGVLAESDLVMDFARGAAVGPLSAFFSTPTQVEWAQVTPRESPVPP